MEKKLASLGVDKAPRVGPAEDADPNLVFVITSFQEDMQPYAFRSRAAWEAVSGGVLGVG
ncbi:MAG: hypothetical protein QOH76_3632 [Thermoleophilaceae bacterium]|nr:hypothetical protein [Thermoleophilaceae bacterium]